MPTFQIRRKDTAFCPLQKRVGVRQWLTSKLCSWFHIACSFHINDVWLWNLNRSRVRKRTRLKTFMKVKLTKSFKTPNKVNFLMLIFTMAMCITPIFYLPTSPSSPRSSNLPIVGDYHLQLSLSSVSSLSWVLTPVDPKSSLSALWTLYVCLSSSVFWYIACI